MAIAFVAAADGGNATATSLTFSYTCGSGSNRLLIVAVIGDLSVDDVTGVTYNGVAMTLIDKQLVVSGGERILYFYYLLNPSSGANNVVVSASSSHFLAALAADYTGVSALDNSTKNEAGSVTSLTTSLTTVANNCWTMLAVDGYSGNSAPTAGTGSTRRTFGAAFGNVGLFDSNAAITPAGSYSMSTGYPGSTGIGHVMASFAPVSAASAAGPTYMHRTQQRMN